MRLEPGEYGVIAKCAAGYELAAVSRDTLAAAKRAALSMVEERELIESGMTVVEVRGYNGDCLADYFVESA
jgi:hypothetical protein